MTNRIRPRLTFSNVVSVLALFLALGGGALAATKLGPNQVKSKNIAPDAVRGEDALESSFGTVPSAAHAQSAATAQSALTAQNADTLGGVGVNQLQRGNGADRSFAWETSVGNTENVPTAEGTFHIHCENDGSSPISYDDKAGDGFITDFWGNDGVHANLGDGSTGYPAGSFPTVGATNRFQLWGGSGRVDLVTISGFTRTSANTCAIAATVQESNSAG